MCEEAGEVLEAHLLTTLLPSIEHAILIGDHRQLKPQIAKYELSSENPRGVQYSLDTSLFEHLLRPHVPQAATVPYSTLRVQRRMHPSIVSLVRNTLYPGLVDHQSVQGYPEVEGKYSSEDVAVLTPYLGQLVKLRNKLSSSFEIVVGDRDQVELEQESMRSGTENIFEISLAEKTSLSKAVGIVTVDDFQVSNAHVKMGHMTLICSN